ncbi:elongation factor 2 kinase, putative [Entamoeba invadens IP1]|uniref:Elongation factor 2 kinase, putative n=1 Tax=Entamoeba invadens IP1 TaxID=370355 RepID=A0A0A1U594_ENTIV|nr:elongation factor 2 kinase, putative [Entamoeba invadens IP1]ELP89397.1 elongation factor 2 kinase, putative [Entamoeba invadens IP1]|eukprot:XP_004256168.1 elongation factor 2 kinase, putative [Entamoeba invadens IP1]
MSHEMDIDPTLCDKEPNYQTAVTGYVITVPNETEQIQMFLETDKRINEFHFSFTTFNAELTPFAKGGERLAFRAITEKGDRVVLKRFYQPRPLTMLLETVERQLICIYLANLFNKLNASPNKLHFLPTYLFMPSPLSDLDNKILTLEQAEEAVAFTRRTPNFVEPYLHGYFIKYIDNNGWINEDEFHSTLHAFAHWTWVQSKGNLLICDIQGVSGTNKFYLTDPALHHIDSKKFMFSETNLGEQGITKFFSTHQCNAICLGLHLRKHTAQVLPDTLKGTTINPDVNKRIKQYYQQPDKPNVTTPTPKPKPQNSVGIVEQVAFNKPIGKCVALFPFTARCANELTLAVDDVVDILAKLDGWWVGKKGGNYGIFPVNFVQELLEKFLYVANDDFIGGRGMLPLKKGDRIYLLAKSGNMYKAVKFSQVGFVPKTVCSRQRQAH